MCYKITEIIPKQAHTVFLIVASFGKITSIFSRINFGMQFFACTELLQQLYKQLTQIVI